MSTTRRSRTGDQNETHWKTVVEVARVLHYDATISEAELMASSLSAKAVSVLFDLDGKLLETWRKTELHKRNWTQPEMTRWERQKEHTGKKMMKTTKLHTNASNLLAFQ